jgi:hypothetical protein
VYNAGVETLELKILSALFRNLSAAEARANQFDEALKLRLQWFQTAPESVSVDRWLKWTKEGFAKSTKGSPGHNFALELLKALQVKYPQDRSLTQALADAFEAQGDYRGAALLYRELLRP